MNKKIRKVTEYVGSFIAVFCVLTAALTIVVSGVLLLMSFLVWQQFPFSVFFTGFRFAIIVAFIATSVAGVRVYFEDQKNRYGKALVKTSHVSRLSQQMLWEANRIKRRTWSANARQTLL